MDDVIGSVLRQILQWVFGGGAKGLAEEIRLAHEAKLRAETDEAKLAAEADLARLEAAQRMAEIAARDRWSATSLGRYLIVVPFGVWWTAIHVDSLISAEWDVLALPPQIMDMARVLVPAIILADAGALAARMWRR